MKRGVFFLYLILGFSVIFAEPIRFGYIIGEKYRIVSTVKEDVIINGQFSHQAEILNRITVDVKDVRNSSGYLVCNFQTSEESRSSQRMFSWGEIYDSEFWRDELGYYQISPEYFMPIVRNVPVFPERDLKAGDTWTAEGEEVHDFRASFGLPEAVRFPIDASYRYRGDEVRNGKKFKIIEIKYTVFHRPEVKASSGRLYPRRITGKSLQTMYWDAALGRPDSYTEEFEFIFDLSSGDSVDYRGQAEARVIETSIMNKDLIAKSIEKDLSDYGVRDTGVKVDDLGVTLTLENIQFPPDSALLVASEKDKLDRIGAILQKYPERDILITGHTALAGTEQGRKKLSEDRASSVGEYLLQKKIRTRDSMTYRGLGAEVPVADNSFESGRAKNRRVEITILEN